MKNIKYIILLSIIPLVLCLAGCVVPNLEKITSVIEATTITTQNQEQLAESIKTDFKYILENGFPGTELTKFEITKNNNIVYLDIGYNTDLLGDDAMYKEMFDVVSVLSKNITNELCINTTATSQLGDVVKTYTDEINTAKIRNFEMDFSDWLQATNK